MASQELEPRISEIATMRKDVKALIEAVAELPIRLRFAAAAEGLYDLAVQQGLEHEDLGALTRLTRL